MKVVTSCTDDPEGSQNDNLFVQKVVILTTLRVVSAAGDDLHVSVEDPGGSLHLSKSP